MFIACVCISGLPADLTADMAGRERTVLSMLNDAYERGDIDYETALVDQVLSIFEPQYVKDKYGLEGLQPDKCATSLFMEIRANWKRLSPATQDTLLPYLLRPTEPGSPEPYGHAYTTTAQYFDSPGEHFRIWYVSTTDDAPSLSDVNPADGVPDWVNRCAEICDEVWEMVVDSLGFQAPPQDGSWYPAGQDYGGSSRYDVYIEDLGQSIFAYTQSEYGYSGSRSATSYIVLDDDYWWYPSYNQGRVPLDAMKVTVAHEFFHAVHFGYDALDTDDRWWMEISSVWMENTVYDDVDDYIAYLPSFFNDPGIPLDEFNGRHEYGSGIWAMFLDQKYGVDIVRSIWEYCVTTKALQAAQTALADRGSSLAEAFQLFTVWNYFTGSRANQDLYYDEGDKYPTVTFKNRHIQYPASGEGTIDHLAADYIGFIPMGATDSLFTSFAGAPASWGLTAIDYQSSTVHAVNDIALNANHEGFHTTPSWSNFIEVVLIPCITNISGSNFSCTYQAAADSCIYCEDALMQSYPNPFRMQEQETVYFPFSLSGASAGVTITVRTLEGDIVWQSESLDLGRAEYTKRVHWDGKNGGERVGSGIYIYTIQAGDFIATRKMALIR